MRATCHRCGGDLPTGDGLSPFCPHCGAPQLFLSESYLADQLESVSSADTTGALPPPLPRQVDWKVALRCAFLVAAIAAVLSVIGLRVPGISFLSTIWILTASMSTLALYQHRRPRAWMDAGVGARVGLTTGLALIVTVGLALAIAGVVARFGLHSMAGFDADFAQILAQSRQTAAASAAQAAPEVVKLYDLPEFQAGIVLASLTISAIFLLIFSAFGGALGGMLRNRRHARP
ncbi:zinc ribbon domain-containing protein [Granulicella arctica]|uniref:Zinc ribbon domain-containing protein n=1 Tax=Granulicella arctica TaxID=940613 RepID=A0A7Y9PFN8_9BACT|nr:zinc ribbon domain-containing protein [Granulicella arctica]NYF78932.1 hypothetical protein [Granulicella arctica]